MRNKEMLGCALLYLLNAMMIWIASIPQMTTWVYTQTCKSINLSPSEELMSNPIWTFLCGIWSSLCILLDMHNFFTGITFIAGLILPFFYAWLITILMSCNNMRLLKNKFIMAAYFISFFIYIPAGCLGHVKFLYWTSY